MKALVIGFGSIGKRHARILTQEFRYNTAVVSQRNVEFPSVYHCIDKAVNQHEPDYIIIANDTHRHYEVLAALSRMRFDGRVLIEKPIFESTRLLPALPFRAVAVGYNLRFHPLIRKLRDMTLNETVVSVSAYVGQYLPSWRPNIDYRKSYSANGERGGGVLGDLSHELDYLTWMFGEWTELTALGGHFSSLEICSDDIFTIIGKLQRCPLVSIQLSYLDRTPTRRVIVNTSKSTIEINLTDHSIKVDGDERKIEINQDFTYTSMHHHNLFGGDEELCTVNEALMVVKTIENAKFASEKRVWIKT